MTNRQKVIGKSLHGNQVWLHTYESYGSSHHLNGEIIHDLQTDGRVLLDERLARKLAKELLKFADTQQAKGTK